MRRRSLKRKTRHRYESPFGTHQPFAQRCRVEACFDALTRIFVEDDPACVEDGEQPLSLQQGRPGFAPALGPLGLELRRACLQGSPSFLAAGQ
jgi:hypothetical protein